MPDPDNEKLIVIQYYTDYNILSGLFSAGNSHAHRRPPPDEQAEKQLALIRSATRQSITGVITHSLDLYYRQIKDQKGVGTGKLMQSDFVSCAKGLKDLSANYKRYLGQSRNKK